MARGIYEFLNYVGQTLTTDSDIKAFCEANFGKNLSVFIGEDESLLPTDENCPCVLIKAGGRGLAGGEHLKNRSAKITICIKDSIENEPYEVYSGVKTFPGLALLDEIEDLITETIENIPLHPSGYYISETTEGQEDQIQFPIYKAFLGLTVTLDSDY